MSSANGLPSNRPLPSNVVASSAPASSASASSAALGARPGRAAPADDDRPLGLGDHRGDLVDDRRVGPQQLLPRHQIGRRRVVGQIGKFLLLQIERHAQHHRLALGAGDVKRLAHAIERPVDRADRHKMRAGRQRQRRLVDRLDVPGGADRRVAGKHHNRRVAARRHHQRGHDLGIAGAAGHRSRRRPCRSRGHRRRPSRRSNARGARGSAGPSGCRPSTPTSTCWRRPSA